MNIGAHHLHVRKRMHVNRECYPHTNKTKAFVDHLAYLSILTPILTLPQLSTIYRHHSVTGLSLITWSTYLVGAMFWSYYGFLHNEKPIIVPNVLMSIVDFGIVIGILIYR